MDVLILSPLQEFDFFSAVRNMYGHVHALDANRIGRTNRILFDLSATINNINSSELLLNNRMNF